MSLQLKRQSRTSEGEIAALFVCLLFAAEIDD